VALWGPHIAITQGVLSAFVADTAPPGLRGTAYGAFNLAVGVVTLLASVFAPWCPTRHRRGAQAARKARLAPSWRGPTSGPPHNDVITDHHGEKPSASCRARRASPLTLRAICSREHVGTTAVLSLNRAGAAAMLQVRSDAHSLAVRLPPSERSSSGTAILPTIANAAPTRKTASWPT
jgi:hypothetical protein